MLTEDGKRAFLRLAEEAWDDIALQYKQRGIDPYSVTLHLDVKAMEDRGDADFSGGLQLSTEVPLSSRLARLRSV